MASTGPYRCLAALGVALGLAACRVASIWQPSATPPSPVPLNLPELKSLLLDEFGELFYCDPDYYPVPREDESVLAEERFPEISQDAEEFPVLLRRLAIDPMPPFTAEEQLTIYREHKKVAAVYTEPVSDGYRFQMRINTGGEIEALEGEIDLYGRIRLTSRQASTDMCPICLARGTRVDTPGGEIAVEDLRAGMLVWSVSLSGERMAVPIEQVAKTLAPGEHRMIRLVLDDGRILLASPGHPLPDGRPLESLRPGEGFAGTRVLEADPVPYSGAYTYDLLPGGETGLYWAEGILLKSSIPR